MAPERADVDGGGARETPQPARFLHGGDRRHRTEPLGLALGVIRVFAVDARRLRAEQDYENARLNVMLDPLASPIGLK